MIVVVGTGNKWFGRVGRVNPDDYDRTPSYQKVTVQFGSDGPFARLIKRRLIPMSHVSDQLTDMLGTPYLRKEDFE